MSGWQIDYCFTEEVQDKLMGILSISEQAYEDFICQIEGEYPEICSFHTNEFSVYISTSDERFKEIQKGVIKMINKKYREYAL